ncbi:MAG TPA: ABC transporter permease, partial [Oleiagrimonas sp.]|nr:ABC transporter permease [Oleiagrimonas sp.]
MVIVREFREAWRRLSRRPGYALLSIMVLGVGLGVTLFAFSLINTLVLDPLPFPQAGRLVAVGEAHQNGVGIGDIDTNEYLGLRDGLQGVDEVGAYAVTGFNLDSGAGATFYRGTYMTASMLSLLGTKPILGRDFSQADAKAGAPRVILIGESLWKHAFQADPKVIGRAVKINGQWAQVIGVMPAAFGFRGASQIWMPLVLDGAKPLDNIYMIARLKPGVTLVRARQQLHALDTHLRHTSKMWRYQERIVMKPMAYAMVHKDIRHWVWLMFGASVLVLLLACVNVGNLQLVQTLNRKRELALRSALGSSRTRLMAGVLTESLLLSIASLALALPIVALGKHWLLSAYAAAGRSPATFLHFGISGGVLLGALALALASTLIAGGVSAWRASKADLQTTLRDGGKGSGSGFAHVAKGLVVLEVVLTVVLLVGAGTFVRAVESVLSQPVPGTAHAGQVLTAYAYLPHEAYRDDAQRIRFYRRVAARLNHDAGVVAATVSDTVPGAVLGSHEDVSLPGQAENVHGWPEVQMGIVESNFLATYGLKLREGRFFDARDTATSQKVAVVDATLATQFWPHVDPVGRTLVMYPGTSYARQLIVIGVVEPLMLDDILEQQVPGVLTPLSQAAGLSPLGRVGLAVRTHTVAGAFSGSLTQVVHAVDPRASVYAVRSQADAMASNRVNLV